MYACVRLSWKRTCSYCGELDVLTPMYVADNDGACTPQTGLGCYVQGCVQHGKEPAELGKIILERLINTEL